MADFLTAMRWLDEGSCVKRVSSHKAYVKITFRESNVITIGYYKRGCKEWQNAFTSLFSGQDTIADDWFISSTQPDYDGYWAGDYSLRTQERYEKETMKESGYAKKLDAFRKSQKLPSSK